MKCNTKLKEIWICSFKYLLTNKGYMVINTIAFLWFLYFFSFIRVINPIFENNNIDRDALLLDLPTFFVSNRAVQYYLFLSLQVAITAILSFSFTSGQRSSTFYFSLPLSRRNLFYSRFLGGIFMITVVHTALLITNLILGRAGIGYFYLYIVTLVSVFLIYSITVAISITVGTIVEKIFLTLGILLGVNSAISGALRIVAIFLHGNNIGENYMGVDLTSGILTSIPKFLPPMGVLYTFEYFFIWYEGFRLPLWANNHTVGFGVMIIWVLLACILVWWSCKKFTSFPPEKAGVLGLSPFLSNVTTIIVPFAIFVILPFRFQVYQTTYTIIKIIGIILVIAILCRIITTMKLRKLINKEAMILYGVLVVTVGVLVTVGLTGGLGFSSYQPPIDNIVAVRITYPGAPEFISGRGNYGARFLRINEHLPAFDGGEGDQIVREHSDLIFVDQQDIQQILDLHSLIIDAGAWQTEEQPLTKDPQTDWLSLQVRIRYYLEDGSVLDRLYTHIPVRVALEMLHLDNTNAVRNSIDNVTNLPSKVAGIGDFEFYMTDSLFANRIDIPLEYQIELLEALQRDIDSLTIEEKYFPQSSARAIIHIPRLIEDNNVIGQPEYLYFRAPNRVTAAYDVGIRHNEDISQPSTDLAFEPSERCMHQLQFFITDSYVYTLEFIQDKGWEFILDVIPTITLDDIISMEAQLISLFPAHITTELYFRSYVLHDGRNTLNTVSIPVGEQIEVLTNARTHYYGALGGYRIFVNVMDSDGSKRVALFLPEIYAPSWLENALV